MKFTKYYQPIQNITDYICKHIPDGAKVLELGPGKQPLPKATHFYITHLTVWMKCLE